MPRKTARITISGEDNRDAGKTYLVTEMPALQVEKWAARAFLAIAQSGVEVPDGAEEAGIEGLVNTGLLQALPKIQFHDVEPLMDEMMRCVQLCPDPSHPEVVINLGHDGDIEELSTVYKLRRAVLGLHVDFSKLAALRSSAGQAASSLGGSFLTRTSPDL